MRRMLLVFNTLHTTLRAESEVAAEEQIELPVTSWPFNTDQNCAGDDLEMLYLEEIDVSALQDSNFSNGIATHEHWKPPSQKKSITLIETPPPRQSSFDQTPLNSPHNFAFDVDDGMKKNDDSRPMQLQAGASQNFY